MILGYDGGIGRASPEGAADETGKPGGKPGGQGIRRRGLGGVMPRFHHGQAASRRPQPFVMLDFAGDKGVRLSRAEGKEFPA